MRYTRKAFTDSARHVLLLALLALVACGAPWQDLRPGTYERGKNAYDDGSYTEAVQDLKLFIRRNPTDDNADDAQFYVGKANMDMGDYPLAAVEFEILRADYPNSELYEESFFLEGMCYVEQVPSLHVDSKVVGQGIAHFDRFLRAFPSGEFSQPARDQLAALRLHVDRKKLKSVELYRRMGKREAALVTIDAILEDNPDTELKPELLFVKGQLARKVSDDPLARRVWSELVQLYPDHELAEQAREELAKLDAVSQEMGP